jgi:hypothetical protein
VTRPMPALMISSVQERGRDFRVVQGSSDV